MSSLTAALRLAYPRALATLVRVTGSLDEALDLLQTAVTRALERWPEDGFPDVPEAWLVSLTPVDGTGELTLVLGLAERARPLEAAIAETVTRAVQAGADRPIAVACATPGSALMGHARRCGIGIATPEVGSG